MRSDRLYSDKRVPGAAHARLLVPCERACTAARHRAFLQRPSAAADKNRRGTFQMRREFDFYSAEERAAAELLRLVDPACRLSHRAQTCRRIPYLRSSTNPGLLCHAQP